MVFTPRDSQFNPLYRKYFSYNTKSQGNAIVEFSRPGDRLFGFTGYVQGITPTGRLSLEVLSPPREVQIRIVQEKVTRDPKNVTVTFWPKPPPSQTKSSIPK